MQHAYRLKQASAADELFDYRSLEKKKLKLAMILTGTMMLREIIDPIQKCTQ